MTDAKYKKYFVLELMLKVYSVKLYLYRWISISSANKVSLLFILQLSMQHLFSECDSKTLLRPKLIFLIFIKYTSLYCIWIHTLMNSIHTICLASECFTNNNGIIWKNNNLLLILFIFSYSCFKESKTNSKVLANF